MLNNTTTQENSWLILKLIQYSSSTPKYLPKRSESTCSHTKKLYFNVHRTFLHNSPKLKTAQKSINRCRNKQIVDIFIQCNSTVLRNKKEMNNRYPQ